MLDCDTAVAGIEIDGCDGREPGVLPTTDEKLEPKPTNDGQPLGRKQPEADPAGYKEEIPGPTVGSFIFLGGLIAMLVALTFRIINS